MERRANEDSLLAGEHVGWTASPPSERDPASTGPGRMSGPTWDYKFLDYGWDGINGGQQPVGDPFKYPHDPMAQEYTAREEGWIYVFVSNENSTLVEVYGACPAETC